ncbi:hypothetical protein HHK36_023536 [Tetracentron sinense]|uniref:Uncharacterized protein n=1 Tax=Tetracentron sinense TaxID=13715 RepID=A0A835D8S7_TETSI|nr:hypothetical protein HHK36_033272 [Tetracentron sinense]KAF8391234.1 hypothetical protein HHK36_023536 [Tetracentron sinense]
MAKFSQAVSALCFLSLLGFAYADSLFYVQGKVYCDTCRAQFETKVSEYIPGAKVRLECKDREGGQPTYSIDGETDATGTYRLPVEGDHEEEICEVVLVKSSNPDCAERLPGRDRARVLVTANNGISSAARFANSLGFMKKEALPQCPQVLKELGIVPGAV